MANLKEKLEALQQELLDKINSLIEFKGSISEHGSDKVLKIRENNLQFNIDNTNGHYVEEIATDKLISQHGYEFGFECIPLENLCEIIDAFKEEVQYVLGDNSINGVELNEKITDEELFEYRIEDREELISNLIGWISEARYSSKGMMVDDLEYLMEINDDYILSSISTNEYVIEGDIDFNRLCQELLELSNSL